MERDIEAASVEEAMPGTSLKIMERASGMIDAAQAVAQMRQRVSLVDALKKDVMQENVHYGNVPGTDKPTLLQPGAQKLLLAFGLRAIIGKDDVIKDDLGNGHREMTVFVHICNSAGEEIDTGVGSCSTLEAKYRYRGGVKTPLDPPVVVPKEYWNKRSAGASKEELAVLLGGPGLAPGKIDGQWLVCEIGEKMENPDIADCWNTVLKIAVKRGVVAGAILATGSSDFFTQDVEDNPALVEAPAAAQKPKEQPPVEPRRASEAPEHGPTVDVDQTTGITTMRGAIISNFSAKQGTKRGGGTYTRYGLQIGSQWINTFDTGLADLARSAKEQGTPVTVRFKAGQYGLDLVGLDIDGEGEDFPPDGHEDDGDGFAR